LKELQESSKSRKIKGFGGYMTRKQSEESFSERETIARREAALRRMLATPHKPHEPLGKKSTGARKRGASTKPKKV
jgi:hypothetical protein